MAGQRTLLVIADIGGYTRFMKVHRVNLAHAQQIVGRLLEAVIDGAEPGLKLSKLEGDAALFYAPEGDRGASTTEQALAVAGRIRRAFLERREMLAVDRLCSCDSCTQVSGLKLKFAVHVGEVAIQKVRSFRELAGMDVILVHRMLKNGVPATEYALLTEPVHAALPEDHKKHANEIEEDFEGVGPTKLHWIDLEKAAPDLPVHVEKNFLRALWAHIMMNVRSILYILGAKKSCDLFRNMDDALGTSQTDIAAIPERIARRPSNIPPPDPDAKVDI